MPPHYAPLSRPHWDDLAALELALFIGQLFVPHPAADGCSAYTVQLGDLGWRVLLSCPDCRLQVGDGPAVCFCCLRRLVELTHQRQCCASSVQELGQLGEIPGREETCLACGVVDVRKQREQVLHLAAVTYIQLCLGPSQGQETCLCQRTHPLL